MQRRHFLATMLSGLPALSLAESLPGKSWAEDVRLLRSAFEQLHPGLHRYLSPSSARAGFDTLEREFARAPSVREAYLRLSRFLSSIRCGHTYANFYNQSDAMAGTLFAGRTRVPFHFRWLANRMVVTRPFGDAPGLVRGTEILELDGRPAASLLRELAPYSRTDGHNDFKRRALLSVQGDEGIETFDVFQGLLRPPAGGVHRLKVRGADGRVNVLAVPAIDLAERRRQRAVPADKNAPAWRLEWPADSTGCLVMPSWALYNSSWDWRTFLDESFRALADRQATHLVIDLRGNEGGTDDCGRALLSRVISQPLEPVPLIRRTRYRRVPDELNRFLDTWDDSFRDWGDSATPAADGYFELRVSSAKDAIVPSDRRFTGRVTLLVDSANSSATFDFARQFQAQRLGRLVGEPTGGNRRGTNGGAFFFLRLPESGLEVDLPLIGYFPASPQPDEGIEPDVLAVPTIDDIAAGRDRAMAVALAPA